MTYQRLSDLVSARKEQAENALRHFAFLDRFRNSEPDKLCCARMRRVCVDDHGAAGSQSRSCVATGNGISEREVACAKNRSRADRPKYGAHVGLWNWLAVRDRVIYACVYPRTVVEQICKYPQLAASSCAFADEASIRQRRFERRTFDQSIAESFDIVGDRSQEFRTFFACEVSVFQACSLGKRSCGVHLFKCCRVKRRFDLVSSRGIESTESLCGFTSARRADYRCASKRSSHLRIKSNTCEPSFHSQASAICLCSSFRTGKVWARRECLINKI